MPSVVRRIARVRQAIVDAQLGAAADDFGFGHLNQRRVDAKLHRAFDAGFGRQVREPFERRDELRPAVRVAGVVDRVHTDEQVGRPHHFSISQRQREKHRVAGRHIGDRNAFGDFLFVSIQRHVDVVGQRAAAKLIEPDRRNHVPHNAERRRHAAGGIELEPMPLAVVDRQRK